VLVVLGAAGDRADFVKAGAIDERVDPLAHGKPTAGMLPRHLVGAAELRRQPLALAQFVEFRLPACRLIRHSSPRSQSTEWAASCYKKPSEALSGYCLSLSCVGNCASFEGSLREPPQDEVNL
jgi:hypothetical protein